ncbi:MAG: hypothetical protein P1R58_13395 [bacterium]|nr:hypothetical protein [bacterium]
MRRTKLLLASMMTLLLVCGTVIADNGSRIYGKLTTVDGDTFEGLIRWDKNEGDWVDVLNGNKEIPDENFSDHEKSDRRKYSDRGTSIQIFGLKLGSSNSNILWSSSAQSGIRFGHIKRLKPMGNDEVRLTLKTGEEIELSGGSTDIGDGIREIIIEDRDEGEIELVWDDIEMIEFMQAKTNEPSIFGHRLYGTLETRRGDSFTGYVCWDVDELFANDILDGDYKGRRRKIKFGKLVSIERYSSSGAKVRLSNGDEMVLKGTNDVDDSNSGIIISDPAFGQIQCQWDEFERLEFHNPTETVKYEDFDGGAHLKGTVTTEDGDSYSGDIRWDNDEEFGWEILDGEYHDLQFDIEMGLIKMIEKRSHSSSIVTVSDGRTFRLRGSNDVDDDNKGIVIVQADGEEVLIEWEDFEKVEFARR